MSIGVDLNYNFGTIQNSALAFEYTPEGEIVQYQTRQNTRSDVSGLNLNFGLSFKTMLNSKLELSTTATYAPESELTSNNERSFSTLLFDSFSGSELIRNTLDDDLESQGLKQTKVTIPSRISIGAGIGKPQKWFVGGEYTYRNTSNFSNPIFGSDISSYENSSRVAFGGFYIPNYDAFSGYFKRVVYRAGINFANTGLVIKDQSIKEFGISFGLGLPVGDRSLFSNANLGVEFGQRGTTNENLIQENFINFNVSLSLNSRWFQQRKYN